LNYPGLYGASNVGTAMKKCSFCYYCCCTSYEH